MQPLTDQAALIAGAVTTAAGLLIWALDKIGGSVLEHRTVEHLCRKRALGSRHAETTDHSELENLELKLKLHVIYTVANEAIRQRDAYRAALIQERKLRAEHTPPIVSALDSERIEADQ